MEAKKINLFDKMNISLDLQKKTSSEWLVASGFHHLPLVTCHLISYLPGNHHHQAIRIFITGALLIRKIMSSTDNYISRRPIWQDWLLMGPKNRCSGSDKNA